MIRILLTMILVVLFSACGTTPESSPPSGVSSEAVDSSDPVETSVSVDAPMDPGGISLEYTDDVGEVITLTLDTPTIAPPNTGAGVGASISPFEGVKVKLGERTVEIDATVCLDAGFLEQIACSPGSREHEALVVTTVRPSDIHAAMLLAGFEAGSPGRWVSGDGSRLEIQPPQGSRVRIGVRYIDDRGEEREHDIGLWITSEDGRRFPRDPWVFGGSVIESNREWMGPGEHYVADMTGSIVGLVTFGDEVIGWSKVRSDKTDIHPAEWQVARDRIPPLDTPVTLLIRPAE